jgi:hypothetical protein
MDQPRARRALKGTIALGLTNGLGPSMATLRAAVSGSAKGERSTNFMPCPV